MKRRNAELKPEKKIARAEINDWNGEKNKVKKKTVESEAAAGGEGPRLA